MLQRHHHLVSGEVHFIVDNALDIKRLNAVLVTKKRNITGDDLGKAQRQLQMHFFNQMAQPELIVADVWIASISYLGQMTDAEFAPTQKPTEAVHPATASVAIPE